MTDGIRKDPRSRFSDRVENYVRFRPTYPAKLLDELRSARALQPGDVVADVGAGTGVLTRLFLEAGHPVLAIEPNREMLDAAVAHLGGNPGFTPVLGSAEDSGVEDACAGLVIAGQAFHWFDPPRACREFARILQPGRMAALVWNDRKRDGTPFLTGYEALLQEHGTDYAAVQDRLPDESALRSLFTPESFRQVVLPNQQELDGEGLNGRLLSASYLPGRGEPGCDALLAAARRLFRETAVDGAVTIEYHTTLSLGRLRASVST